MDFSTISPISILHKYKSYAPPASQQNVTKGSYLRSPPSAVLSIPNIQCSQVGRIGQPHSGSIHSKHLNQRSDIQNDESYRPTEDPPHQFMDGEIKHIGCVPPCPYQTIPPPVSSLHDRPEAIFLSGTSLQVLPFPTPLVITKILKFPLTILRVKQINTMAYLDDWILWSPSKDTLAANIATTINLSGESGFLLNLEKSHTSPTQDIQ